MQNNIMTSSSLSTATCISPARILHLAVVLCIYYFSCSNGSLLLDWLSFQANAIQRANAYGVNVDNYNNNSRYLSRYLFANVLPSPTLTPTSSTPASVFSNFKTTSSSALNGTSINEIDSNTFNSRIINFTMLETPATDPLGASSSCRLTQQRMLGVMRYDSNGRRCAMARPFYYVQACGGQCLSSHMPHASFPYYTTVEHVCQPSRTQTVRVQLMCDADVEVATSDNNDIRVFEYEQAVECECMACRRGEVACMSEHTYQALFF